MAKGKRRRFRNRGRRRELDRRWNGWIRKEHPELGPDAVFEDWMYAVLHDQGDHR